MGSRGQALLEPSELVPEFHDISNDNHGRGLEIFSLHFLHDILERPRDTALTVRRPVSNHRDRSRRRFLVLDQFVHHVGQVAYPHQNDQRIRRRGQLIPGNLRPTLP